VPPLRLHAIARLQNHHDLDRSGAEPAFSNVSQSRRSLQMDRCDETLLHESLVPGKRSAAKEGEVNFLDWLAKLKLSEAAAAQGVHFLVGFTGVFLCAHYGANPWIPAAGVVAFAGFIEFWFDAKYEHQPLSSNLTDFLVYAGGAVAAVLLHYFAG
jgi:hypothetical protein